MKRILIAALVLCLALLSACKDTGITFNLQADLPEGTETLTVTEVGRTDNVYYVKAQADGQSYTFRLAEDFQAYAFEPGVLGAQHTMDYKAEEFYSRWYQEAKERNTLGTVFSFAFDGDAIYSLSDTSEPAPINGEKPQVYKELPEGVVYKEGFELQSDPGDNLSAPDAALTLWNTILAAHDDFYTPGDAVTITLTGLESVYDAECYLYTIVNPHGESEHAVDYASGAAYVRLGGEYMPIGEGRGGQIPLDQEQAMDIVSERLRVQLDEGMALVAKGTGDVNGQTAFLFDLGTNTPEKFTAEAHYAVTDDAEVWLLDIHSNQWQPAAAG